LSAKALRPIFSLNRNSGFFDSQAGSMPRSLLLGSSSNLKQRVLKGKTAAIIGGPFIADRQQAVKVIRAVQRTSLPKKGLIGRWCLQRSFRKAVQGAPFPRSEPVVAARIGLEQFPESPSLHQNGL
jgi:hypothetical protein